jgi:hypothetical protein
MFSDSLSWYLYLARLLDVDTAGVSDVNAAKLNRSKPFQAGPVFVLTCSCPFMQKSGCLLPEARALL